ncbi:helix-turn-helix domain-containing protein [Microlunatus elymi]|uniref:Helix-turn-helix domain-containing protein n=1 Tax=Microlunatus elymi TaxID=2596828 RepID=A0A516PUV3_9ACTN|nr:helix-turn-helix domain-containing protein [Microlunatus elymi]QDP94967.1 helix-turn-helix domain-containing protein [Microlunatus elymi]
MYELNEHQVTSTSAPIDESCSDIHVHTEIDAPTLLLRIEDAAARLGIARSMMYELVRSGEVESVRVGRLRRIPVECLEEYVSRLRAQTHAASA